MSRSNDATLITSAQRGASLDLEARQRRYLITMGVRTACFLVFLIVPGWWKVVALAGAALLPAIGVLLANNADRHVLTPVAPSDEAPRPAIADASVVPGTLAHDEGDEGDDEQEEEH